MAECEVPPVFILATRWRQAGRLCAPLLQCSACPFVVKSAHLEAHRFFFCGILEHRPPQSAGHSTSVTLRLPHRVATPPYESAEVHGGHRTLGSDVVSAVSPVMGPRRAAALAPRASVTLVGSLHVGSANQAGPSPVTAGLLGFRGTTQRLTCAMRRSRFALRSRVGRVGSVEAKSRLGSSHKLWKTVAMKWRGSYG